MSLTSYSIDWDKWIRNNLHPERRTPKRIALLKALIKAIRDVHTQFEQTFEENKEKLKWDGQKIILERLLQITFGDGITIENMEPSSVIQIEYPVADLANPITFQAPNVTNPINGIAGSVIGFVGFKVKVPSAIAFDQDQMKALINKYLINYNTYAIELV